MKTFLRAKIFFALGLLLTSASLLAAGGPPPPTILSSDAINVETALPPPPAAGSRRAKKELHFMEQIQKEDVRPMSDCDRAAAVSTGYKLSNLFGPPYGPLRTDEVNNLEGFFDKIQGDINFFGFEVKNHWKRPRPYAEDPAIVPCPNVPKENSPSYPSGHTTVARVFGRVLSDMDPSRRDAFMARADQVASDRVMSGLHHPSDIKAGKKFGDEIYKLLKKNESFKRQLQVFRNQEAVSQQ